MPEQLPTAPVETVDLLKASDPEELTGVTLSILSAGSITIPTARYSYRLPPRIRSGVMLTKLQELSWPTD